MRNRFFFCNFAVALMLILKNKLFIQRSMSIVKYLQIIYSSKKVILKIEKPCLSKGNYETDSK